MDGLPVTRRGAAAGRWLTRPLTWIVVASAGVYQLVIVPQWDRRLVWDSAFYVALARSLARGDGYTYMGLPHAKYPPIVPLMLAPIELVFGDAFLLMRALMVACALAVIVATWFLMHRLTAAPLAAAVTVMTAGSYALFDESTRILSDVPYAAMALAALWAGERLRQEPSARRFWTAAVLIAAAYLTRTIGFTVAVAVAVALVLGPRGRPWAERARGALGILAVFALVAGLWIGRGLSIAPAPGADASAYDTYGNELLAKDPDDPSAGRIAPADLARRVMENFGFYQKTLIDLLTGTAVTEGSARTALAALWLGGWLIALVRRRSAVEIYVPLYAGVLLLWPTHQGKRFLVPLLPMIFLYALEPIWLALQRLTGGAGRRIGGMALAAVALVSVAVNAQQIVPIVRAERSDPYLAVPIAQFIAALAWVRDNTAPDAVLITDRAPMAHVYADRVAHSEPWVADQERVLAFMRRQGATHVIANGLGLGPRYLLPVVRHHPQHFREIHRMGENVIYAFVP
jgi:4-amino-4-deoxy-L-arabinose transferase-like glycosyltransferase